MSATFWRRPLGRDHPWVGLALNDLAVLYKSWGRYAEAEPLFHRVLAIYGKSLTPEHPRIRRPR